MVKVAIFGATGRLGMPLTAMLGDHPQAQLEYLQNSRVSEGNLRDAEVAFLALRDEDAQKVIPRLKGKRVIDLSTDRRTMPEWVYGLPEVNREQIKDAQLVANPGCYATAVLLALEPFHGYISNVIISATSGISGAGQPVSAVENSRIYGEGTVHKHLPEIEKMLGLDGLIFAPQVIENTDRGIVATIFARYNGPEDVLSVAAHKYRDETYVDVTDGTIQTKDVNGTNLCRIKPQLIGCTLMVNSTLDNIVKGGAGQAVQNFNIMYGFPETWGLPGTG